ncbi:hypothetical protein D3C71_1378300 [compost metagenome]
MITLSKLTSISSETVYTELYKHWKINFSGSFGEISVLLNKFDHLIDLEFSFNYSKSKFSHFSRGDLLDYFEERYDFDIDKDYFSTYIRNSQKGTSVFLKMNSLLDDEQIIKFFSDIVNSSLDRGVV